MVKEIWLNLPVKDVTKSKDFFKHIGFSFNTKHGDTPHSAALTMGKNNFVVMLFDENMFKTFTKHELPDTSRSSQMLISFDAESREEVDEIAQKVKEAGGSMYAEPGESQGWMYACGFIDLDGHRWNILHMDMDKMPK